MPLLRHGLWAGLMALSLIGVAEARAPGPDLPPRLPPVASIPLRPDSFDVRAFDPLGMPEAKPPALTEAPPPGDAAAPAAEAGEASPQAASLARLQDAGKAPPPRQENGLFSDGWSRDGFGSLR